MSGVIDAMVSQSPPHSSMHIQRMDGGFVCAIPPGPPVGAYDGNCAAATLYAWIGGAREIVAETSPSADPQNLGVRFSFASNVAEGAVFQTSKIRRAGPTGDVLPRTAFLMTFHCAAEGSAGNVISFSRSGVMERFRRWVEHKSDVLPPSKLVNIQGIRPNLEMAEEADTFRVRISPPVAPGPLYSCHSDSPGFDIGIADSTVVHHIAHELGGDTEGAFMARFQDEWLEIGPRVFEDDV